jgi:hypothetical protein
MRKEEAYTENSMKENTVLVCIWTSTFILTFKLFPLCILNYSNEYSRCYAIGGLTNIRFYATVELLLDHNNGNGDTIYVLREVTKLQLY